MVLHQFFFYLTIVCLPTQVGLHFWPEWALILGRRIDYLSPTIFFTDITIFLTLLSYLVSKRFRILNPEIWKTLRHPSLFNNLKSKIKNLKFFLLPHRSRLIPLLLLVLFVVHNICLSASPAVSIYKWIKILEFLLFGFYIYKTKPTMTHLAVSLSIAVFYSSLIAIGQFLLQHSVGGPLWFLGERTFSINTPGIARIQFLPSVFRFLSSEVLRPYATFPHPNVLGGFLAVTVPFIIYYCTYVPMYKVSKNIFYIIKWCVVGIGLFTLIIAFSKSAWILGIIGIIISILISKKNNSLFFTGSIVFVGVIFLLFTIPYLRSLTPESESVYLRQELATHATSMWKSSPIVGVGLGNNIVLLPKYFQSRQIFFLQPVHSLYLLLLSETGVIGLTMFFLFLMYALLNKKINNNRLSVLVSCIILLFLGSIDHYPLTLQQGQLLFVLFFSLLL